MLLSQTTFVRPFELDRRAPRLEVWTWLAVNIAFAIPLAFIEAYRPTGALDFYAAVVSIPSIFVYARRMRDTGVSGWWVLLNLIPIVNIFVVLYLYFMPGESEKNVFG